MTNDPHVDNESAAARRQTALVIGGTGLVGSHLLPRLLGDERFDRVVSFTRRSTGISDAALAEHIVSFDAPDSWRSHVRGDVLFSTLGTTIRAAGSKDAQWRVDHTYQLETARTAAAHGVACCVLVSSAGASAHSRVFYSRMKGQLEDDIAALGFARLHILRPGLLVGRRTDRRSGERIGLPILRALNALGLFRAYRPIHADTVARAMITAAFSSETFRIHEPADIVELAADASERR